MKTRLKIVFMILSLWATALYGQVGMTGNLPHKSAALDLNEINDNDNKKGLSIPRISLGSSTDVSSINGGEPARDLLIYNTNNVKTNGLYGMGFYYWENNMWNKLATIKEVIDMINASSFAVSSSLKSTGTGSLTSEQSSGISTTVMATSIGSQETNVTGMKEEQLQPVLTNAVGKTTTGVTGKAFTYVKYIIKNVDKDNLRKFNTNISIGNYVVEVVGASFKADSSQTVLTQSTSPKSNGSFGPEISAFEDNGQWALCTNYRGADTAKGEYGTWTIYCMVIDNSIVKTLPEQSYDLKREQEGSAAKPAGL